MVRSVSSALFAEMAHQSLCWELISRCDWTLNKNVCRIARLTMYHGGTGCAKRVSCYVGAHLHIVHVVQASTNPASQCSLEIIAGAQPLWFLLAIVHGAETKNNPVGSWIGQSGSIFVPSWCSPSTNASYRIGHRTT